MAQHPCSLAITWKIPHSAMWPKCTVPPPTNFVNARFVLASHWPMWGATALARLARAQLIGVDGVEPQEGRRCFASCVVGQRNGEGTDHGDGADFCVDFGDINIANFVAAIAAGGVLVVKKPGAHAATWVANSLHLISTRCPLCWPAASWRVGVA